jgi:L-iditol 2-dehydrogenase
MPSRTLTSTMKAAVYHGANDLRVESVPVPKVGAGDVLVRVAVCGVSTGDVRRVQMGLPPFPRVLGNEIAGTIETVGDDVDGWRVGDRVVVHATESEESDEPAGGGFAELVRVGAHDVDEGGLVEVPRDVPFEEAIFLEPVNTCLRGIRLLDLDEDDVVLVAGVGSLGLILQQLAIREGARVVAADPLQGRLALAKALGAERVVDPKSEDMHEACRALTKGRGADAAIVAAIGAGPVRDAIKATRRRAKILLFGQVAKGEETAVDVGDVCLDEKHLIGSHAWSEDEADEADEVVFRREIELARLITHRFPLEQVVEAFRKAGDRGNDVGKVVLLPSGEPEAPARG